MPRIEIYTKGYCPYCRKAKALLHHKGARFVELDVSEKPELFDTIVARAQGRRTVPQIFIGGVGIGGSDELSLLQARGQLDQLLDLNAVLHR